MEGKKCKKKYVVNTNAPRRSKKSTGSKLSTMEGTHVKCPLKTRGPQFAKGGGRRV
jgi:hypothetical protein